VVGGVSAVAIWDLVSLNIKAVAADTKTCNEYGELYGAVKSGIFDKKDKDRPKFHGVFYSLYVENVVINLGNKIVIPPKFLDRILTELCASNIGVGSVCVGSMKKVVSHIFWWPEITKLIIDIVAKRDGCRRYRNSLTPHSGIDRCSVEFISEGNLSSPFPHQKSDVAKQSELTVTRHSTARLRNRKSFEAVIIHDNNIELSYLAVVSEILGTNNCLILSDNRHKNVSGDNMSSSVQLTVVASADDIDRNHNDILVLNGDNVSVASVISDESGFDIPIVTRNDNFKYKRKCCKPEQARLA
jgi:hypothetical protein